MWVCWCPVTWCLSISPEIFVSRKVLYLQLSGISWSKSANLHWMFPFCYWEPDLKYSPSSLMIRENHQRCAKLLLRAWQTRILFWGQGSKPGQVSLVLISGSSGFTWEASWFWAWGIRLLLVVTHWNFFGTAWQATAGPANQSSIPAAETSQNVFLQEKRCVHNFSWIKIMGSTTRSWWSWCVKIDSKTSRFELQAIMPLHLSINSWHCWCS